MSNKELIKLLRDTILAIEEAEFENDLTQAALNYMAQHRDEIIEKAASKYAEKLIRKKKDIVILDDPEFHKSSPWFVEPSWGTGVTTSSHGKE